MHVKHVSSVTFYHLSNRNLPSVMKISAKINTINILLIVRSLSLTNWYGPISDRTLLTLQLTSEESVFRHVSVQMVDILNTFCKQTLANNLQCSCAFGSCGFYPSC